MCYETLPTSVLSKATFAGNEYAWPLAAVEEAIQAVKDCGLANIGGQVQFRVPKATCELYWLSIESREQLPGEPWEQYVTRSADEILT
jgi:hypothetical protein